MTSDDVWAPLRAAVPSFAEPWGAHVSQPWYEDDASYGVSVLARHLVDEAADARGVELAVFDRTIRGEHARSAWDAVIGFLRGGTR